MVIDYSKWDNFQVSSLEDEDEAPTLQIIEAATSDSGHATAAVATQSTTATPLDQSGLPSWMTAEQYAGLPKIVLLVRSSNRDRIVE